MVKDYANKPYRNTTAPRRRHTGKVILIVAIGMLLPLSLFVTRYLTAINHSKKPSKNTTSISSTKNAPTHTNKTASNKLTFDFYTLLPELEVEIPQTHNPAEPKRYVLQIASLQDPQQAERLKSQLIALGYHSTIQRFAANQTQWYRVLIGPFPTITAAKQVKSQLRDQELGSIILKQSA